MARLFLEDDLPISLLIGFSSISMPEYRLIYEINKSYSSTFQRINDLKVVSESADYFYSCYSYTLSDSSENYYLIKNRPYHFERKTIRTTLANIFLEMPFMVKELKAYPYFFFTEMEEDFRDELFQESKSPILKLERKEIKELRILDNLDI